jgi:LacI family transcriptional regulator
MRKSTIIDVAREAGVSWKTVSRVINNEPNVRQGTALKVREAVARLGYQPNIAARSLAGARSFLIGAITANPSPHYMTALHRGASRACRARGYHLAIEDIDPAHPDCLADLEHGLRSAKFDGVLLCPPTTDIAPILDLLDRFSIPYVRIDPLADPDRAPSLYGDDAAGVEALAEHFWAQGYRRFGIVKGPATHRASRIRHDAFARRIAALGGPAVPIAAAQGDFSFDSGVAAGGALIDRLPGGSAIFACNDEMAAGVIAAAGRRRLAVPEDVAVAGFDDSDIARMIWPPLTTIRQLIEDYARIAVDLLTRARGGEETPPPITLPVELVIRGSTRG